MYSQYHFPTTPVTLPAKQMDWPASPVIVHNGPFILPTGTYTRADLPANVVISSMTMEKQIALKCMLGYSKDTDYVTEQYTVDTVIEEKSKYKFIAYGWCYGIDKIIYIIEYGVPNVVGNESKRNDIKDISKSIITVPFADILSATPMEIYWPANVPILSFVADVKSLVGKKLVSSIYSFGVDILSSQGIFVCMSKEVIESYIVDMRLFDMGEPIKPTKGFNFRLYDVNGNDVGFIEYDEADKRLIRLYNYNGSTDSNSGSTNSKIDERNIIFN